MHNPSLWYPPTHQGPRPKVLSIASMSEGEVAQRNAAMCQAKRIARIARIASFSTCLAWKLYLVSGRMPPKLVPWPWGPALLHFGALAEGGSPRLGTEPYGVLRTYTAQETVRAEQSLHDGIVAMV
jgi:hypothetical protein